MGFADSSMTGKERRLANLKPFAKGVSGNPGGSSKRARLYRRAIEKQETPDDVARVVAAMRHAAINDGDTTAARVYLEAVRVIGRHADESQTVEAALTLVNAMLVEARARALERPQAGAGNPIDVEVNRGG